MASLPAGQFGRLKTVRIMELNIIFGIIVTLHLGGWVLISRLFIAKRSERLHDRKNNFIIQIKITDVMTVLEKLQAQVTAVADSQKLLAASAAQSKASLDAVKTGIATIVANLNPGGLSADEVKTLSDSLTKLGADEQANADTESANAAEATEVATAIAAAQPAVPPPAPVTETPAPDAPLTDQPAA